MFFPKLEHFIQSWFSHSMFDQSLDIVTLMFGWFGMNLCCSALTSPWDWFVHFIGMKYHVIIPIGNCLSLPGVSPCTVRTLDQLGWSGCSSTCVDVDSNCSQWRGLWICYKKICLWYFSRKTGWYLFGIGGRFFFNVGSFVCRSVFFLLCHTKNIHFKEPSISGT